MRFRCDRVLERVGVVYSRPERHYSGKLSKAPFIVPSGDYDRNTPGRL